MIRYLVIESRIEAEMTGSKKVKRAGKSILTSPLWGAPRGGGLERERAEIETREGMERDGSVNRGLRECQRERVRGRERFEISFFKPTGIFLSFPFSLIYVYFC